MDGTDGMKSQQKRQHARSMQTSRRPSKSMIKGRQQLLQEEMQEGMQERMQERMEERMEASWQNSHVRDFMQSAMQNQMEKSMQETVGSRAQRTQMLERQDSMREPLEACKKLPYLGMLISPHDTRPDPARSQLVRDMPSPESDLNDALNGAEWFSAADCCSAYHQVMYVVCTSRIRERRPAIEERLWQNHAIYPQIWKSL